MNQPQRSVRAQAAQAFSQALDQLGTTFDIDDGDMALMDNAALPNSPKDKTATQSSISASSDATHAPPLPTVDKRDLKLVKPHR